MSREWVNDDLALDTDLRGEWERPGRYWARPATALTSSDEVKPGTTVWHVYLWATGDYSAPERLVVQKADREWFYTKPFPNGKRSMKDCSLDGSDYNNNYLFASEADALDAIANKKPRARAA